MPQPILAVGVDPAKRLHRAVAVLFPDQIILDVALPNACDAVANLDDRLAELANQHGAELVYGLEDHRRYGRLFCQLLTERGRELRVVNPLWTSRQRAFYGQDKDDAIAMGAVSPPSSCGVTTTCLWPPTSARSLKPFVKPSGACKISTKLVPG